MNVPAAVAVDSTGHLYIAELADHRIRRVDADTGLITTVAGIRAPGFGGDGGPAIQASLDSPSGVTLDPAGHLYIADTANNRIRRVDVITGIITTVAGSGQLGFGGDGGPATQASLSRPNSVTFDSAGNLYVADTSNNRIRRIDAGTGIITSVAGNGLKDFSGDGGPATQASLSWPGHVTFDSAGNLYIADTRNNRVRRVDVATGIITTVVGTGTDGFGGDGGPATQASLWRPESVAFNSAGNLYIADGVNDRIRRVDATTGTITTVAGGGSSPLAGDGGPATQVRLVRPDGIALDAEDHLYFAETGRGRVRRVEAGSDIITTVAGSSYSTFLTGDGGPATQSLLRFPQGATVDPTGNLYISNGVRIRRLDATTGIVTTVAGNGQIGFGGDGGPATQASLYFPVGLDLGPEGNIYIACYFSHRIRRVDADTGIITTVAGNGREGFTGDGGPATQATIAYPNDVALSAEGHLYIADLENNRIRRVDADTGIITTVAGNGLGDFGGDGSPASQASLNSPSGVTLDATGNLFIADRSNGRIRRVDVSNGTISTVVGNGECCFGGDGGPATQASLRWPLGVALDATGNIYIADTMNERIRRVAVTSGIISTIAGSGESGFAGDGGPATQASLNSPAAVAVGTAGQIYIADSASHRVRAVFPCVETDEPILLSPSNGSVGLSASLGLGWKKARGAFRYDLYLDTTNPPQHIVAREIETESFSLSGLEPLTTYYWRVLAKGDPYCDPFRTSESEVWSFTTTSSCDVPGGFTASTN